MSWKRKALSNVADRKQLNCAEFSSVEAGAREGRGIGEPRFFGFYYVQFEQQSPVKAVGLMVKRKKTLPAPEELENG